MPVYAAPRQVSGQALASRGQPQRASWQDAGQIREPIRWAYQYAKSIMRYSCGVVYYTGYRDFLQRVNLYDMCLLSERCALLADIADWFPRRERSSLFGLVVVARDNLAEDGLAHDAARRFSA